MGYLYLKKQVSTMPNDSRALIKDLTIPLVEFVIRQVCIPLGHLDAGMPCQFLRQLKVSGGSQYCGNEVMPERVWGDSTHGLRAERLLHARSDNIPAGGSGHGFDLLSRTLVVPAARRE